MANRSKVTIPAKYVDWVRQGVATEIELDARAVGSNDLDTDLRQSSRYLEDQIAVLHALVNGSGDVELVEDAHTLAHIVETTGRKVIGPKLAEALGVGPWATEYAGEHLYPLVEAMEWAVTEATFLHEAARPAEVVA